MKKTVKAAFGEFFWFLSLVLANLIKKDKKNEAVLLVPAANLNGGFGEDIMVTSFIENFSGGKPVTIFTHEVIERPDYLSKYPNIRFQGGFGGFWNYILVLKVLSKHSIVYVIGADIMDGTYGRSLTLQRLRLLKLAASLGMNAQVSGFSISNKILPVVKKNMLDLSETVIIKSRDVESYQRMLSFIPKNNTALTNDIAFICPDVPGAYQKAAFSNYLEWCRLMHSKGIKIIAVCPNSIQARKSGISNYIEGLQVLLNKFLDKDKFAFVFLYHDIRPLCGNDTDSTISKVLYDFFTAKGVDCYYTNEVKNGVEVKGYLSSVDFTVTGRMHFGISGLTYGKPMFGISYANKFEGMVRLFNIDPQHCLVNYDELKAVNGEIGLFINNYTAIKDNVAKNLEQVKQDTRSNFIA